MRKMKMKTWIFWAVLFGLAVGSLGTAQASTSKSAHEQLNTLLLGKDVKALVDLPAYKDGVDVYYVPRSNKRTDERGIDLEEMTKWLKDKGVGVDRDEWVSITNVKIDGDKVEIHLEGGGEGGGAAITPTKWGRPTNGLGARG